MTVLPLQRLLTRSRRPAILARHRGRTRDLVPRQRRTYRDSFFADPVAVEDDYRRMRPCARR